MMFKNKENNEGKLFALFNFHTLPEVTSEGLQLQRICLSVKCYVLCALSLPSIALLLPDEAKMANTTAMVGFHAEDHYHVAEKGKKRVTLVFILFEV